MIASEIDRLDVLPAQLLQKQAPAIELTDPSVQHAILNQPNVVRRDVVQLCS